MAEKKISQELVPAMVAMDSSLAQIGQYVVPQTEGPFNLTSVFVYVTKTGTPDPALISLYVYDEYGVGGEAGTLLASATAISTSDMTTPGWVEYVLDTPVEMANGTGYWILVLAAFWSVEESPASNYWSLGCSTANPHTAGVAVTVDLFGTYAYPTGYDLGFQLWAGASYLVTPVAPVNEATGEKIIANGLSWDSVDVGVVFDAYLSASGGMWFSEDDRVTPEGGTTDLFVAFPFNLYYGWEYHWIVKEYTVDPETGERTLVAQTAEQRFDTQPFIYYPVPSRRTVPAPAGGGETMNVITGDNCLAGIRRIVAACNNEIWYEAIE